MVHWVHSVAPFLAQASACCFGADWAKTWCFVSNKPQISISVLAQLCPHQPGTHEQIVGVRLPDGSFKSRLTAEYPAQLAATLASVIQHFTTHGGQEVKLDSWPSLLPSRLSWPAPAGRVEDGGGLSSSALSIQPCSRGVLDALRLKWFQKLLDTKDCLKIMAKLQKNGVSEPPLDEVSLPPYLLDLLEVLGISDMDTDILHVVPGQPFKLTLWRRLASLWSDPDLALFDLLLLEQGVPWA